MKLETYCVADRGESENVHELSPDLLSQRKVVHINIADNPSLDPQNNPTTFVADKADPPRGPLTDKDWAKSAQPVMTVYKLITIEFKWFGLQTQVESWMMSYEEKLLDKFHRKIFCSMNT